MALLSEKDYSSTIEALEYFLEVCGDQLTDQDRMEKQALLCWIKMSKSKLSS